MIILFRPFKDGDFVQVANGEMGTVKQISINYTELASIGNVQIIVPNSDVWGNTIQNYSVYPNRQAEWTFGVSYDASLAQAEEVIRDTLLADKRTKGDSDMMIKVNNLGDSSVDFLVRAWVSSDDYFGYQADMKRAVKEALDAADIGIPYPHRTLTMTNWVGEGGGSSSKDKNESDRSDRSGVTEDREDDGDQNETEEGR